MNQFQNQNNEQQQENNGFVPKVQANVTWLNKDPESKLKAFCSIKIADSFVVSGLKVMSGNKGLFVSMPSESYEKNGKKEYRDTAYPTTNLMRTAVHEACVGAYQQVIGQNNAVEQESSEITEAPGFEQTIA